MRVGILTSNDTRHRHFVNAVARSAGVVAVCYEDTGYVPADTARDETDDDTRRIVAHHFAERARQEERFFGHDAAFLTDSSRCVVRRADRSSLNAPETVQLLRRREVDTVLVYGTDLIRPPLLTAYAGRMINMHLGLSPYYRGTATNFYPLLNNEPEYVGATIHLIDPGIDTGPIVRHARPDIVADDMPHTVGCKAILAGIRAVLQTLDEVGKGSVNPVPQWHVPNAKVYFRKHYHPRQVVQLYRLLDAGLFPRYVERASRVANRMRLIA